MTSVDRIVAFVVLTLLIVVIGFALRSNSRARLGIDGRGEA